MRTRKRGRTRSFRRTRRAPSVEAVPARPPPPPKASSGSRAIVGALTGGIVGFLFGLLSDFKEQPPSSSPPVEVSVPVPKKRRKRATIPEAP